MPSVTQEIEADADTIWRWLTVPELMNQWISSVADLRSEDGAELDRGSRLLFAARGQVHYSTVVEFATARALTLRSTQGPVTADYRYRIDERMGHCEVTLDIDCRASGVIRVLMPAIRIAAWLTDRGQIQRLKALIESQRGRTSTSL